MPDADFFTSITSTIWDMIITYHPAFAEIGRKIFAGLILYRLYDFIKGVGFGKYGDAWLYELFELLELVTIALIMQTFYSTPIPGVGYSFTQLITGTTSSLAKSLDASLMTNIYHHFQAMHDSFVEPGWGEFGLWLLYCMVVAIILLAKALTVGMVGLSLIFSALALLVGPLFVPWILLPSLSGWFWGWFRSLVQWSFLQVSSYGYLFLFEHYLRGYLSSLPTDIPPDRLQTYGMQATVIAIVFVLGIVLVKEFNSGLFSGGNSATVFQSAPLRRYV